MSGDRMISGTLEHLRKPFVANVRPGSRVLIVTDTAHDARVWQAALTIVASLEAEATVALFEPRPADYYDPPEPVRQAMLQSDVNFLLTSTGLFHSPAAREAMKAGVPCVCMDGGMTLEMFQAGAVTADYVEIARLKHAVANRVYGGGAKCVRVTSTAGTDIQYSVEGRIFAPQLPGPDYDPFLAWRRTSEGRKDSPIYGLVFPTGEFNVPPVEGSANGVIVIDLTMHHIGRLSSPISITVERGRIKSIDGGADAWTLRRYLAQFGDEHAYAFPTEASIGLNRVARITGCQREDKNIFGAMHFGLGTNADVGGTVTSLLHMDGVVLEPTIEVDGEVRVRDGKFLVPLD